MASKGKGKSKFKKGEIKFRDKRIDGKRFAYDVIKYSVLKFGVSDTSLDVWEGPDNDYGYPDFCLIMFRRILYHQIPLRYTMHACFNQRYESNNFESLELIRRLLQDVINKYTELPLKNIEDVEISLAIACELVLFLLSKNLNFYLSQVAEHWFDCYLHLVSKQFENAGVLDQLYLKGTTPKCQIKDHFNDLFISKCCIPYNKSIKILNLQELYTQGYHNYIDAVVNNFTLKDGIYIREYSLEKHIKEYEIIMLPITPEWKEYSENDRPINISFGKPQYEELCKTDDELTACATQSQNPPGVSRQKPPQHLGVLSSQERINRKYSSCSYVEQGHGQSSLVSLGAKKSIEKKPSVSVAKDTMQSYDLLGAKPKTTAEYTGSSGLQTSISSLYLSVQQDLGQLRLDSSGTKKSSEKKHSVSMARDPTQSYERYGAKPISTVWNRKSSDLQTEESSLCSSEEQGLGQLSFDSSKRKRPGEENSMPSVSKYLEFPEACDQELSKNTKGPSYQKGKRNRKRSNRPRVERSLEQLSLDSSGTKQSSEENPSVSIATGTAKAKNAVRNRKSSDLQTGESSL